MSSTKDQPPEGLPPSYSQATGSSTASTGAHNTTSSPSSHLQVPNKTGPNAIPIDRRRSMEDEARPLPAGWVRQYDTSEGHQFFVDTKANPPRSIWHHPYDDDEYLRTLSSEERERLQESDKLPSHKLHDGESTDEEGASTSQRPSAELPPRPGAGDRRPSKGGFGTKLKDKLTGTTKEERQRQRAQRAEEERQYYEAHQKFRVAMDQAMRTGQPVFFAKDRDGRDVYVEPPGGPGGYGGQAPQYGAQQGRPGQGGRMVNPYSNGPYADPNARFIRPQQPYNRPYGYGYGGYGGGYGYGGGMGMGVPVMGGLMGGLLLGGLLF